LGLVGRSAAMQRLKADILKLHNTNTTVLITGESGTGKERIAEALQQTGPRRNKPFLKLNCTALNDELLASELFGHAKGAFTGAVRDRPGLFEAADGGTLFLDEIGDITPRMQASLLRVLQEGEFQRVGETRTRRSDVRVIAATNRDLKAAVQEGRFREDLFYRLNVMQLHALPLRERRDDILPLARHFLEQLAESRVEQAPAMEADAIEVLQAYSWPGNARELRNVLERALVHCQGERITAGCLPDELFDAGMSVGDEQNGSSRELSGELTPELLRKRLEAYGWVVARTAKSLGFSRQYLHKKMKQWGIHRPEGDT
ncbi:AAA domain-containing protein, partial [bacterium]|nr:AAA domain-containing protein [bacterium]